VLGVAAVVEVAPILDYLPREVPEGNLPKPLNTTSQTPNYSWWKFNCFGEAKSKVQTEEEDSVSVPFVAFWGKWLVVNVKYCCFTQNVKTHNFVQITRG
jgi:hypothetical protein